LLTVLTGPVAFAGKPTQWGAEYAMKKINASGGIRGVPIKIISYDTAMDNSKAVQVMARAISGNLMVMGPIDLGGTTATSNLIQDNHIFQIAMSGTPAILQSIAPYGGNIMGNIVILNRACGLKWLELQPKIKNVAYFHNPSIPGVTDQLAAVAEAFNKVGVTIIPIELTATQIDFGPSVVKAINANADGYYSSFNS
jgi:ABC-type branched-subunit amino acid transport system substrate-binding protein